jgi:uncharacterized protein (DUF1330 family)
MSAYVIAKVKVTDWNQYKEYVKLTPATIENFGGKFVARGGQMITLEGPEATERIVLIEFASLERVKEWYHSKKYGEAKKKREGAATASLIAIEGI